jgi:putative DNA methylase
VPLKRKLIEVSMPLDAINRESAREKSIRHGHPSTLHLWWARRPLAAVRAVLFAQLVDDPSSHPDRFPTEDDQKRERARLHSMIERLVMWDNARDEKLLAEAHEEILKSTDGNPPEILDPFAGGGTIPLEAQRLGLKAHASDLNPVAVLINKALIEIPSHFRDRSPIFPGLADSQIREWRCAEGLAADVRAYGAWMRDEADSRIGHLYPKADGKTVIAWIWARTVNCPNPACGVEMPLVKSWWLGKKKGCEAFVVPTVVPDSGHPSGKRVQFSIGHTRTGPAGVDGTVSGRTGAVCVACDASAPVDYLRSEGKAGRLGEVLLAAVVEGTRQRLYLPPNSEQTAAAKVDAPSIPIAGEIADNPRWFSPPAYGLSRFADLFTQRQLLTLTTLSDLVIEARRKLIADGAGSDYADAVATYLGFSVSKALARNNTMCGWESGMDRLRGSFQRQAVPMTWDFAEANPLTAAGGGLTAVLQSEAEVLEALVGRESGVVTQADATSRDYHALINTDPPYYDNIGYSDLSDFFYVWLRRSLEPIHPDLLTTMLVPKAEELVANPYRHHGKDGARTFFELGFRAVFARARQTASMDYPIAVWYAFKQSETDASGTASTGWETLLEGMIGNGWEITSTWPFRTEMASRMISAGTNALASSIVLSLRPRPKSAPTVDRRSYLEELRDELPRNLRELQQGAIAPVDLAQAAIGPGMAVFSRNSKVVEPNGSNVSVREALRLINTVLAEVLSDQEGDFDTDTRWCIKWFETHGFQKATYGDAETLATAFGTTVSGLNRSGAVAAKGGEVHLLTAAELPVSYRPERDDHITLWEVALHLVKALDEKGLDKAGRILHGASSRIEPELVKELAYLVFSLAEKRSMTMVAGMYNALVTSWPEVTAAAQSHANRGQAGSTQAMLDLDDTEG